MTFAELQRGVFDDLQYQAQPKPGVQDRVRRYLNEGLERVLRRPRLKQLRLGSMPLTSAPGQGFYGAPMALERIDYVVDLTNGRRLGFRTRDWYRGLDPSLVTSGTPSVWIAEGVSAVQRQPRVNPATGYTDLYAFSLADTDRTQKIRLRVTYFLGNEIEISATLQGSTPVLLSTQLAGVTQIRAIYLDATTTDYVMVSDAPGVFPTLTQADILANIRPPDLTVRYLGLRLHPTPSAAIAYEIEGQRVIPKMTLDEDEPPFSADFHEMLQCYARGRFYRKDGRLAQAREEFAEFERFALDLTAHVEYPVNYKPVAGKLSADGARWSDLGPTYPADRVGVIAD